MRKEFDFGFLNHHIDCLLIGEIVDLDLKKSGLVSASYIISVVNENGEKTKIIIGDIMLNRTKSDGSISTGKELWQIEHNGEYFWRDKGAIK